MKDTLNANSELIEEISALKQRIQEKEFDFIRKPLSHNKLLQKVREVLDR